MKNEDDPYEYTALFNFKGKNDPLIIKLMAVGSCPRIKLSKTILTFGECPVNSYRDIKIRIENDNQDLPIDFGCKKIAQFSSVPQKALLKPKGQQDFIVTFKPNNMGSFTQHLDLLILDGQYTIPLKVIAMAKTIVRKKPMKRGVMCLPEDFRKHKNNVTDDSLRTSV